MQPASIPIPRNFPSVTGVCVNQEAHMRDLPRISKPTVGLQYLLPLLLVLIIMVVTVGFFATR